jgi:hypothetical protein
MRLLNTYEGTPGNESQDNENWVKSIVAHPVIGRDTSFTISFDLHALKNFANNSEK